MITNFFAPLQPQHQHLGGSHHAGPGWDAFLAEQSFPPSRPDSPCFPANPPTLAGRPGCLTAGWVLAADSWPRRVGLGGHLNSAPIGATTRTKPPSSGYPVKIKYVDFMSRGTHRLLVTRTTDKSKIHAEFLDHLDPATPSPPTWAEPLCPFLPRENSWSVYWDASWRTIHPPTAQAVFGIQGTHDGRGALYLTADFPDWCPRIAAVRFEIPSTLQARGGTAHMTELLAIHAGLHLLHTLKLRGTVYSDCLAAVNKITRRWTPGRAFQDTGATLVTASRAHCSDSITILWTKGHSERSKSPPSTWSRQQWGIYVEIAWARTTDKHRDPSPMLRQVTDWACYLAQWVRGGGTLCSTISTRSICFFFYCYVLLINCYFATACCVVRCALLFVVIVGSKYFTSQCILAI